MKKIVVVSLVTIGFFWANTFSLNSMAQTSSSKKLKYRPFSKRGQVTGSVPGGKRGTCKDAQVQAGDKLTAIAPSDGAGASLSTKPMIWIYSPYTFPANKFKQPIQGEFKVRASQEACGQVGESIVVDLPMIPGFIPVQMTQPVKNGQSYTWSFTAKCGDASSNPTVSSPIHIASDTKLIAANQSRSTQQQAIEYADKGYWYDAFTLTVQTSPIIEKDVESLLQSGGLDAIVEKLRTLRVK